MVASTMEFSKLLSNNSNEFRSELQDLSLKPQLTVVWPSKESPETVWKK